MRVCRTYLSEFLHKQCCDGGHDIQLLPLWRFSQLGQNRVHEDAQEGQVANLKYTTTQLSQVANLKYTTTQGGQVANLKYTNNTAKSGS